MLIMHVRCCFFMYNIRGKNLNISVVCQGNLCRESTVEHDRKYRKEADNV